MIVFSVFASAVLACPGSNSPLLHAGAKITAEFQNSCAEVAEEIEMRAGSMANGVDWTDPHNKGKYKLLKSSDSYILIQRTTANNVFTDKADFTLTSTSSGGCKVQGCSESQGISAADNGTNFCNMWSLFCNSQDCEGGNCCKVLKNDLQYTVDTQSCSPLPFSCPTNQNAYRSTCIKNASDLKQTPDAPFCPGSICDDEKDLKQTPDAPFCPGSICSDEEKEIINRMFSN